MAGFETQTYPGANGGMDLASPIHMLAEDKARWIIDGLVDVPGIVRQRGALNGVVAGSSGFKAHGMMATFTPDDKLRLGILLANGSGTEVDFFDPDAALGSQTGLPLTCGLNSTAQLVFDAKPALANGVLMGYATSYRAGGDRAMGYWRGGSKATYTTGTITVTRGATSVAGAGTTWTGNVEPGMFLFLDNGAGKIALIGVVKTVNSNTSITLEQPALVAAAAKSYQIMSVRPTRQRLGAGRITCATTSPTVNGGGTKFRSMATPANWELFRAKDLTYIGTVSSVASPTQLTLTGNAAVAMENEQYLLIENVNATPSIDSPIGNFLFNAVWQGRQFLANAGEIQGATETFPARLGRVAFSELFDAEAFDLSDDGNWLEIPSTAKHDSPIVGLAPTETCLVVFREAEVWGIFGSSSDPTTWSVRKILDDGALSPMSITSYKGGVLWAGRRGMYVFDGTSVTNLTEQSLGDFYVQMVQSWQQGLHSAWGMVDRDHFFVHFQAVTMPHGWFKVSSETTKLTITVCINLRTQALTLMTNVGIRGSCWIPAVASGDAGCRWIADIDTGGSTHQAYLYNALDLFEMAGDLGDRQQCFGEVIGPAFYIESCRYDMGDPQLKKLFRILLLLYSLSSNTDALLEVEVVPGMGNDGTLSSTELGSTGSSGLGGNTGWTDTRFKFLKRDRYVAFRAYTKTPTSTPFGDVQLGPWAIGFKRQRPGRV